MRFQLAGFINAVAALLLISSANAATIIDLQPDLLVDDGDCTFYENCSAGDPDLYGAENFTLANNVTITDVSFYAIVLLDPANLGSVDWLIMQDSAGAPGSVVGQGDASSYTSQSFGSGSSFDHYRFDIDITDTSLNAGDYWLAFGLNGGPAFNEFFWSVTAEVSPGSETNARGNPTDGWILDYTTQIDGKEFAYRINAVPVPAAVWLFGSALGLLGWARLRWT